MSKPIPVDEKKALIASITCDVCKDVSFVGTQEPVISKYETFHHPSCSLGQRTRR